MSLKIIFTWWNRQTFGTFKNTFLVNMSDPIHMETNIIKVKNERWVIYSKNIEATKITSISIMDTSYC